MNPTVGQMTWFFHKGQSAANQRLAAIITHVWSGTMVNLAVFDGNGTLLPNHTSVEFVPTGHTKPASNDYCTPAS